VSATTSLDFYDAELRAHHEHLRSAYGISPGDEVLDVGCGTGLTTREAARAAAPAAFSASTCPSASSITPAG
jgi:cyclopropane fatty-acyl-phospholipid synthase-like methyltransferase